MADTAVSVSGAPVHQDLGAPVHRFFWRRELKMPCDHETFIWGTLDHHETFCFVDFGSNDYFSY